MPHVALKLWRDHLSAKGGLFLNRHGFDHVYPFQRKLTADERIFVWGPGHQEDAHEWLESRGSVCNVCVRLEPGGDEMELRAWRTHVCFRTQAELDAFNLYLDNERFAERMRT